MQNYIEISDEHLNEILEKHKLWLEGKEGGRQANLKNVKLNQKDLSEVNLRGAIFFGADIRECQFKMSDLSGADFAGAFFGFNSIKYSNLTGANFTNASLIYSDLGFSDLSNANLVNADLRFADLDYAILKNTQLVLAKLAYTHIHHTRGIVVDSVKLYNSVRKDELRFWRDLNIWTLRDIQGSKDELIKKIKGTELDKYIEFIELIDKNNNNNS